MTLLPVQTVFAAACSADASLYRSKSGGEWIADATWQVSTDGGASWGDAGCWPTNANDAIHILAGQIVTISLPIMADQVTVEAGGQAIVNIGVTWTISNGIGTDLAVNETVTNAGTITSTGALVFNDG